ncbi:MAG: glycerophosphodiester phosphodiesterase [Rectinemataceae bacterium]|nr:glycerophosphodiester phosphodiesterase [Rectinemataceae bacterium]
MTGRRTLVTAHAGCLGTVPNSRTNIEAALACGADIVEVDIRATKDGIVILTHDDTLVLSNGRTARIGELDWDTLRKLPTSGNAGRGRAGSASTFSTAYLRLDELLDMVRGQDRVLNLDAKEIGAMVLASRLLRDRNMVTDAVFSGLDREGIAAAAERLSGFRYLFNADAHVPAGGGGLAEIALVCSLASASAACGINLEWTKASGHLVDYANRRCLPVLLWTVDEPRDMATALRTGPYSITTNRPDALGALLRPGIGKQGE